jgi:hypothetical protein
VSCTTPDHRRALQLKSLSWKGHAAPAKDSNKSAEIASGPIARHPGFAKASVADARASRQSGERHEMDPRGAMHRRLAYAANDGFPATAARLRRFPDLGLSGDRRSDVAGNGLQNNLFCL